MVVRQYPGATEREFEAGNAAEHGRRPARKGLVVSLFPDVVATSEPRLMSGIDESVSPSGSWPGAPGKP